MVNDNYLDRDFYEIYEENGEKYIDILGYYYYVGDSITDNPDEIYRGLEYSSFVVPLKEFISEDFDYDNFQSILKQYINDCTEEEVDEKLNTEMQGRLEVPYENLTMDIPCGQYYT